MGPKTAASTCPHVLRYLLHDPQAKGIVHDESLLMMMVCSTDVANMHEEPMAQFANPYSGTTALHHGMQKQSVLAILLALQTARN